MPDIAVIKERRLPEWFIDNKGNHEYRLRGGRWNMQRIAEFLIANPTWQTMDDLARVVYLTTSKKHRENVRKHIPVQRKFMLNDIEQPIVTQYGDRGRIVRVKLYNKADEYDRMLLRIELDRARERKEVSDHRYDSLLQIFLLADR